MFCDIREQIDKIWLKLSLKTSKIHKPYENALKNSEKIIFDVSLRVSLKFIRKK
jgi:hypothetical protein